MSFSKHIIQFYESMSSDWKLPSGVDLIYPFADDNVWHVFRSFCHKFYNSKTERTFLFGINPGRFGAGMTGVPFTDPVILETHCNIPNNINKRHELSCLFVYEMIELLGGVQSFYKHFYISSLCPLGFIKDKKNYNYYDDSELFLKVRPYMIKAMDYQISKYCNRQVAFSLGQGKNFKVFNELNAEFGWFDKVVPLPHPRWVMQYKRKTKEIYLNEYLVKLKEWC